MAILQADDLFRFYHPGDTEVRALRGASLNVSRGEIVALVGPSGSGKSTFLACIAGLDEPDGGMVTVDGQRMTRRPEAERATLRARSIGFLAQSGNLFAHLGVAENIALQMDLRGAAHDRSRIACLLGLVGLSHRADALPGTLSGGEAARAGLAVALAADPSLLIADEPTAEVDAATEALILDALEQRRAKGGAILVATHSAAVSARASRVVRNEDGRIVATHAITSQTDLRPFREAPLTGYRASGSRLLAEASDASCHFATGSTSVLALEAASCQIRAGDRIALTGPSGSGKSTLMNILAGLEEPTSGAVSWPGLDMKRPLRPLQIGFVFQSPSLVPALNVIENVSLPLDIAGIGTAAMMPPSEALERLGLTALATKMPDELSGGQMQRVALARALVTRPAVIFADEPTGQLDHSTGREVLDALLVAIAGTPTALIIATHDPAMAVLMTDNWRMAAGRLTTNSAKRAAA